MKEIALFGEAEKGSYHTPYLIHSLDQLVYTFGNPPSGTRGLYLAIQALLFQHSLLFFRVREEGFSNKDYLLGFKFLEENSEISNIGAVGVPGVGNYEIIQAVLSLIRSHNQVLILQEADLYDFLY